MTLNAGLEAIFTKENFFFFFSITIELQNQVGRSLGSSSSSHPCPKQGQLQNYIGLLRALFGQHLNISEMENLDLTTVTVRISSLRSTGISLAATCVHCLTLLADVSSMWRGDGGKIERRTLSTVLK